MKRHHAFFLLPLAVVAARGSPAQACSPVTLEEFSAGLDTAIHAYLTMDSATFTSGWSIARSSVECLSEPLTPGTAATFHLVDALHEYMANNQEGTLQSFQSVMASDSSYVLSREMAPPGNQLRIWFDTARLRPESTQARVAHSDWAKLYVDGSEASTRPSERPAILQWVAGPQNTVIWSGLIPKGAGVPVSVIARITGDVPREFQTSGGDPAQTGEAPTTAQDDLERLTGSGFHETTVETNVPIVPPTETRSLASRPLFWSTAATAVASGTMIAIALATRSAWENNWDLCRTEGACLEDQQVFLEEQDARVNTVRALGYGGQVAAGVALGLGAMMVITW